MTRSILEWGTYALGSHIRKASLLGLRLVELPPPLFMRKNVPSPRKEDLGGFTTVTAHAPYYPLSADVETAERVHVHSAKRAEEMGAHVYNVHLGPRGEDEGRAKENVARVVSSILSSTRNIVVTLETSYAPYLLGSPDDIREIMEMVDSECVGISFQLENDFIRENEVYKSGNFHLADANTDEDFWLHLLTSYKDLFANHVSLRFSQATGVYLKKRIFVKKRTPLGMGYPSLDTLSRALARFILEEVEYEETPVHLIYTGPPETKFKDAINLYYHVAREVARYL